MIRYTYLPQFQPPAPFIYVTLRNPVNGTEVQGVPAQVDTGADCTVLTEALFGALGLPQMGTLAIKGLGGVTHQLPTYSVSVAVHDLTPVVVEAVVSPGEPWVLLGRDVLNAHQMRLDGPQLALEIDRPASA